MSWTKIELGDELNYIYFCYDGADAIKIGIAKDVKRREREIQTSNPNKVTMVDVWWVESKVRAQQTERWLHNSFCKWKKRGEWFEAKPILRYLELINHKDCMGFQTSPFHYMIHKNETGYILDMETAIRIIG